MNRRLAALLLVVVISLSYDISGYPLLEPDEGRNAEIAREMTAASSYLTPRLNGLPYVDKPVLFFAATALAIDVLGPTELAVRLPALLFTLATVALVWWWGRRLFGDRGAWIAAIVTAASPLTLGLSRTVIFDSALMLFVTGAMLGFYEAETRRQGNSAETYSSLAWACLGLGVLTKGPIALALPLMVVVPYFVWRRTWRPLLDPVGVLIFVALVLPWLRVMSTEAPGFLRYVFVTETFQRLATAQLQRTGPWWYFLPIIVAAALPWTIVVLGSLPALQQRLRGRVDPQLAFLLLWILVPLVFFSLSQSKRPQYILPLVPAIGMLVACLWSRSPGLPGARAAAISLLAIGAFLLAAPGLFAEVVRGMTPEVAAEIPRTARILGAVCLVCGAAAMFVREQLDAALWALALPVLAIPLASGRLMDRIGHDRSARELARAIRQVAPRGAEIVGIQAYPLSLPFYLQQTLTLATDDARELTSNYLPRTAGVWQRVADTPLRPAGWWRDAALVCDRPRIFVARVDNAQAHALLQPRMPLIGQNRKYVAYGPCGGADLALH